MCSVVNIVGLKKSKIFKGHWCDRLEVPVGLVSKTRGGPLSVTLEEEDDKLDRTKILLSNRGWSKRQKHHNNLLEISCYFPQSAQKTLPRELQNNWNFLHLLILYE